MDTFQVLKNDPYRRCMLILNNGDNTCVDRSLSLIQLDPQGSHPGQQWPWEGRCPKGENVFCPLWYLSEPLWSFVTRMKSLQVSYMFNLFGGNNVRMTIRSSAPLYTCQRQNFPKNISISSTGTVPGRVQVIFGKGSTFCWFDFQQLKNYNPFHGP